jgi:hypothetical protein
VRTRDDLRRLQKPTHVIDEEATARERERLGEVFDGVLPVVTDRSPAVSMDLSTDLARLRGLEQIMYDMADDPAFLHEMLAFMQQAVLEAHASAERAGDWRPFNSYNQEMPYVRGLPAPSAEETPVPRKRLWCHAAAQEFTLVSPAMHDEFMLRYQVPIMAEFGLSAYGCCEDLTHKIDMLRAVPNLRVIAVTPRADVRTSAEAIGTDYVASWRPNPAEMVCCAAAPADVRRRLHDGCDALKGCRFSIILKDVEAIDGGPERLADWVRTARSVIDETHGG